jgi:hypothetical protein
MLNSDNAAAMKKFSALTGMTVSDFVNDLMRSEVTEKIDDSDFLIDHFAGFGFGDRESALRVAEFINEKRAHRMLAGEPGGMVSREVLEGEDAFELDARRLTDDGWCPSAGALVISFI